MAAAATEAQRSRSSVSSSVCCRRAGVGPMIDVKLWRVSLLSHADRCPANGITVLLLSSLSYCCEWLDVLRIGTVLARPFMQDGGLAMPKTSTTTLSVV